MLNNKIIGKIGENAASEHLKNNGYSILQRNFRTRYGEIDIIAKEGKSLVFVEVKARRGRNFGLPREAVDFYKQSRIKNVASLYVAMKKMNEENIRFDVVEVMMDECNNVKSICLIKDAFE